MSPELIKRTLVGLALIAGSITVLWLGGMPFWMWVTGFGLIMLFEFGGLTGASETQTRLALYAFCLPLGVMAPLALGPDFFAIGLTVGMATAVYIVTRKAALGAGLFYIGAPIFALLWLRDQPDKGLLFATWALAIVWATDIGAYFAGRMIGGPKLAPAISPNKTWAGLIGGVICAVMLAFAFHVWGGLPFRLVMATVPLAVLAQIGDLYESWLKRRAGVKDSGTLLPGHGGALDRLDGAITSLPFAALFVALGVVA